MKPAIWSLRSLSPGNLAFRRCQITAFALCMDVDLLVRVEGIGILSTKAIAKLNTSSPELNVRFLRRVFWFQRSGALASLSPRGATQPCHFLTRATILRFCRTAFSPSARVSPVNPTNRNEQEDRRRGGQEQKNNVPSPQFRVLH